MRAALGAAGRILALACLLTLAGTSVAAYGDADPASDALLIQDSFFPYQPPVSTAWQNAVNATVAAAKAAKFPLKVAIVATPNDLGGLPDLFGQPQRYADFLDREISYNQPVPLLVVMPQGFGTHALGKQGELNPLLPVDAAHGSDGMARAAVLAIERLAADAHRTLAAPQLPSLTAGSTAAHAGGGGTSPAVTFGAPVALVIVVAGAVAVTRRRRGEADDEEVAGDG